MLIEFVVFSVQNIFNLMLEFLILYVSLCHVNYYTLLYSINFEIRPVNTLQLAKNRFPMINQCFYI